MSPKITEGLINFKVGLEIYLTWYHLVGDLKSSTHRPLVCLNGGPGASHTYLLSIADLVSAYEIPVIFYDQLGSGNSMHLRDKPKEFWTVDLFMDELDNLLTYFGIADDFDLLGHSWGGMLGSQFAATRERNGLKHLIISCSPASMDLFEAGARELISKLPQDIQDTLNKHEAAGTTDSQEYHDAMDIFYSKHLCRVVPFPPEVTNSFKVMEEDMTVYGTMNGPSEFHVIGTLKGWSIIDKLHNIETTTLLINGQYDEVRDISVAPFFNHIPKVKWMQFANSSHMPHWEERDRYIQVVGDFLTKY